MKRIKITASLLAAITTVSALTSCSANTAQTNPTVEDSSTSITESVVSTYENDNVPENNVTSAPTAESSAGTTEAAEKENTPATSNTTTDKTGTNEAASTTKQGNDTTSAPTQTTSKAGSSSSSTKPGTVTTTTTKKQDTAPTPTVTTTTQKQDTTPAPATTTTTKKQTTPAPVTTTTKKQTTPAPVITTTTKKQTTPATKTPAEEFNSLSAAEKEAFQYKIAERVAYYFGVEIGTKQTLLPGFTRYAMYRAKLLSSNFEHNANDNLAAARATEYGIYYSKEYAAIYGEHEGWNAPGGYEGIAVNGFGGMTDKAIDEVAKSIARQFKESPAHWKYMGLKTNKYIGVGIYAKGNTNDGNIHLWIFVCQSDANQDAISAAIKECDGNWDLYFEKLDKGEIGPFD
ncbi:MAG: hypothetical protein J1E39_03635 [Eubacterium sp.]|nr:hypothetical protein [Eubacterium sp.]